MCGRYASSRRPEDLVEAFEVEEATDKVLRPKWNVAPTTEVYAVLERDREPGADRDAPVRRLAVVRWGLVPFWAKDAKIGSRMINARVETLAEKPAFRRAFSRRRCLLPADGYYEWYGEQKGRKQPFYITSKDGSPLAMAGLYELWRDPKGGDDADAPAPFLWTVTVITTAAEDALGRIHDRMPMLVEPARWSAWLDPARTDTDDLRELLVPAAPGRLAAYPVGTAVNNVRNDGPELVEPIPLEDVPDDLRDEAVAVDADGEP